MLHLAQEGARLNDETLVGAGTGDKTIKSERHKVWPKNVVSLVINGGHHDWRNPARLLSAYG
jgi:hypothetical protein